MCPLRYTPSFTGAYIASINASISLRSSAGHRFKSFSASSVVLKVSEGGKPLTTIWFVDAFRIESRMMSEAEPISSRSVSCAPVIEARWP